MDSIDNREPVTKQRLQELIVEAAQASPTTKHIRLSDVIIMEPRKGEWNAAFSRSGSQVEEHGLLLLPALKLRYRLVAYN